MNIIKIDTTKNQDIIIDNITDTENVFVYMGNDKLYNYIDTLGKMISSKFLCKLKICKEIDPIDVTLVCGENKLHFSKLSDLLASIDIYKQQEIIVKGDYNADSEQRKKVRTQLGDILQQFIYLNISLETIQVMTEKEYKDNEKVKRFSKKVKEHEKNLNESMKLLSQAKFNAYQEMSDKVMVSLKRIREYLKDAQDNELKIVTAASKKSGKSVIVNSMLKCELAPTSLELATPNNCVYRKSDKGYTLEYKGKEKTFSSAKEMKKDILKIFKEAEMDKKSGYAIPDMNIGYIPVNEGISTYTIYDTPGPDLAGADGHKEAAHRAIEEADVIIFAIDYAKHLTDTEFEYLKDIRTKFSENNKYYSLIIDVNKLDCRYGNEGDKNSVRILDFIRNKLISIAPEFRDAIVIGTSALTYFDCIEIEKIPEVANLNKENNFNRATLEDLLYDFSDDVKKSEEVNAMQFISKIISDIRVFDGVKIKNIEQIKKHSGMPNLLSYVEYIAQNKARTEKVNNLLFKIDSEYAYIQNLFLFQKLDEDLAKNQELLEQAKSVLSTFSKHVSDIYDIYNSNINQMARKGEFQSNTLKKIGRIIPFEINSIFEYCKNTYIESSLSSSKVIKYVVDETIKTKLELKIKDLFAKSELKRNINGKSMTVVPESILMDNIIRVCNSTENETKKHIIQKLTQCCEKLAEECNCIKDDLAKLVNTRLQLLKEEIEICKNSLQEECGITFALVTPEFSYSFKNDISKIDDLNIHIATKELHKDIHNEIASHENKLIIKDDYIHNAIDSIISIFVDREYNKITYDPEYVINEVYDNNIKFEVKKHLEKAKIGKSYEKYRHDIEENLRGFVDYIEVEMNDQSKNALSYCSAVKAAIDHTSQYENNIDNIMQKQETLQIINKSVKPFLDNWGSERY